MMGDVCDYDRWDSGQSRSGLVSSLISWVQKTVGSIAVLLSGFILVWIGFNRDLGGDQSSSTLFYLRLLFIVIPAIGILVSIFWVARYPLNQARMAAIRRDLNGAEPSGPSL
jgi:GPH family glycoside/pentoside/hexuronide:cation symporter